MRIYFSGVSAGMTYRFSPEKKPLNFDLFLSFVNFFLGEYMNEGWMGTKNYREFDGDGTLRNLYKTRIAGGGGGGGGDTVEFYDLV